LDDYTIMDKENNDVARRTRLEMARVLKRMPSTGVDGRTEAEQIGLVERVLCAYLNRNKEVEFHAGLVHIVLVFAYCFKEESDVYYCFERLCTMLDEWFEINPLHERVAQFTSLLRVALPDLYNYFEEEEVNIREWATSWQRFLLAKELPLFCVQRLWDVYLADGLDLHVYVCLALLRQFKEGLEELEQSEIRTALLKLPELDMEELVNQATNIKNELLSKQLE
jgi:hypothetical protein